MFDTDFFVILAVGSLVGSAIGLVIGVALDHLCYHIAKSWRRNDDND